MKNINVNIFEHEHEIESNIEQHIGNVYHIINS